MVGKLKIFQSMKKELLHINKKKKYQRGFSLAEIIIAVSVFLVFVIATSGVIVNTTKQVKNSNNKERASALAEEALEASRNIRDADFNNLNNGTYGISTTGNQWNFSGSSDTVGIFNRQLTISTINSDQKKIDAKISWSDQTSLTNSLTLSTYLTNWKAMFNLGLGLTVNKIIVNHGGTKIATDFAPFLVTSDTVPPVATEVALGVANLFEDGTYTVSETIDPNYVTTFSGDCDSSGHVSLVANTTKVCTITNEELHVPIVATPTVTNISTTSATLGAEVTSLGFPASISTRGTCWGTSPAPTTNCVAEGNTTTGIFTQARTGFTPGTFYYYRGYATNSIGTGYSQDGTFTTTSAGCLMASALVGTPTTYDSASSNSAVVNKPTGVIEGDIMFAHILHFNASDRLTTIPTGWLQIGRHRNGSYNQALYYKVAGASEGTNYTFGFTANPKVAVTISAYRGCFNTTNPIDVSSNIEYVTNNTTYRAASLNLPSANTTVLMFPSMYTTTIRTFANPITQSGGWTEDHDYGAISSDFSRAQYRKFITSAGATGVIDSIGTIGSTVKHAFAVGLKPL